MNISDKLNVVRTILNIAVKVLDYILQQKDIVDATR